MYLLIYPRLPSIWEMKHVTAKYSTLSSKTLQTITTALHFRSPSLSLSHTLTGRSSHAHVPCSPSSPSCHLSGASASPECRAVPPECHLAIGTWELSGPSGWPGPPPPTPRPGGGWAWAAGLRNLVYRLLENYRSFVIHVFVYSSVVTSDWVK